MRSPASHGMKTHWISWQKWWRRAAWMAAGCGLAASLAAPPARAASQAGLSASRDAVMVAFIFNFLQFVEWPDTPAYREGAIVVGVYKHDPFGNALQALNTRKIENRTVEVRVIEEWAADAPVHVLFVPHSQMEGYPALYQALKNQPVLTLGETEDFTQQGGIIRFFDSGDKLRVEINQESARRAGLKISAKLLRLAALVQYPPPE